MLNSHLPWAPSNNFVYDFPCSFGSIIGGYGLRHMCSDCPRASCHFLYRPSGAGQGKSVQRLRGDCTEIVQSQCSCRAVSPASARKSYEAHAASVQRLRKNGARWLCSRRAIFEGATSAWYPCGDCAVPPMTCLWATDIHVYVWFFFSNLYNFPLNTIIEVRSPWIRTKISQPPPASAWRRNGNRDTDSVWQVELPGRWAAGALYIYLFVVFVCYLFV